MLREILTKRKKRKKESDPPSWKENAMQYFFAKKMDVLFFTAIFFSKNPLGLDIVSAFFLTTEIYFLFFIYSYP
ncbi:MAG TPA: hypothetical protein DIS75_08940 [Chryseobacterium sp.]|nr:hypothetical protein [Chryseobacterium sp.]